MPRFSNVRFLMPRIHQTLEDQKVDIAYRLLAKKSHQLVLVRERETRRLVGHLLAVYPYVVVRSLTTLIIAQRGAAVVKSQLAPAARTVPRPPPAGSRRRQARRATGVRCTRCTRAGWPGIVLPLSSNQYPSLCARQTP